MTYTSAHTKPADLMFIWLYMVFASDYAILTIVSIPVLAMYTPDACVFQFAHLLLL